MNIKDDTFLTKRNYRYIEATITAVHSKKVNSRGTASQPSEPNNGMLGPLLFSIVVYSAIKRK